MGGGGGGEGDGDFGFQIAPMVDVVFVLLLFFMACAGQKITEGLLKISLPSKAPTEAATPKTPIVVDIDAQGGVYVNGQPKSGDPKQREIPELREFLRAAINAAPEDPVIIRPALDTKHERVIDVLNACKEAKVQNLSFG
jgi:biopolymer transport protein ExbD